MDKEDINELSHKIPTELEQVGFWWGIFGKQ